MFGGRITTRTVLKTAIVNGRDSFGAIIQTYHDANVSDQISGEKENIHTSVNGRKLPETKDTASTPKKVLQEKNAAHTIPNYKAGSLKFGSKDNVIKEMLKIEKHHVMKEIRDALGNLMNVLWCPVYLCPEAKGRARGGEEIPHHRCKTCGRIGLHLLNDGQKYRPCLSCAGWKENEIPTWYYHGKCGLCEHAMKHQ